MAQEKYKFRMYENLAKAARTILDKARAAAAGENSRAPARSPHEAPGPEPPRQLEGDPKDATDIVNRIRELVKDVYGDSYDACPTSSTGAGLALCRAVAIPDSTMPEHEGTVRGHRMAVIPRQKPSEFLSEFHLLPPKYGLLPGFCAYGNKAGSCTLTAALVPLVGASYSYHGIVQAPVAMLANAQAGPSLDAIAATAEACLPYLSAIIALGTGVPGCGFVPANDDGLPELHAGLGEMACEYDVPFLMDESPGIPILGPDPKKAMASAAVFGPFGPGGPGLVIGAEELVVPMLQLLGAKGPLTGNPTSVRHSASHIFPSPQVMSDMLEFLTEIRRNPERFGRVVDRIYDIATSEFAHLSDDFKRSLRFKKCGATLSVEINYEDTWNDGVGFPVFTAQDAAAGTHLLREGLREMGVTSISVVDAGIVVGVPRRTLAQAMDPLVELEQLRKDVRNLVTLLKIIGDETGYPV
jgi:hypothetical protein